MNEIVTTKRSDLGNLNKLDASFLIEWEDSAVYDFDCFVKTKTIPTSEEKQLLIELGCNYVVDVIFTAHKLDRDAVIKITDFEFVSYLELSKKIYLR